MLYSTVVDNLTCNDNHNLCVHSDYKRLFNRDLRCNVTIFVCLIVNVMANFNHFFWRYGKKICFENLRKPFENLATIRPKNLLLMSKLSWNRDPKNQRLTWKRYPFSKNTVGAARPKSALFSKFFFDKHAYQEVCWVYQDVCWVPPPPPPPRELSTY